MTLTDWIFYAATVGIVGALLAYAITYLRLRIRTWRFIQARRNRPLAERVKRAENRMDEIHPGFTAAFHAEMAKQEQKDRER